MREAIGSARTLVLRMMKGPRARGCMPICIAKKAIGEMQAIGIAGLEKLSAKSLFPRNG